MNNQSEVNDNNDNKQETKTAGLEGSDIAEILSSKGPIVKCVLLRAKKVSNDKLEQTKIVA